MAFDLEKVEEILNNISLDLMMVSTDNLVEISDILGKIEPLEASFSPLEEAKEPARIIAALEEGLKAIICGRVQQVDRAVALVGDGLSMLQELARSLPVGAPFKGDVEAWAASLAELASGEGLLADNSDPELLPSLAVDESLVDLDEMTAETESPEAEQMSAEEEERLQAQPLSAEPEPEIEEPLLPPETLGGDLPAESFIAEFSAELRDIEVALVAAEHKAEPQMALGELAGRFRVILGAASLLNLEDLAWLAFNVGSLIDYVAAEQLPYSPAVTDILLKACDSMIQVLSSLAVKADGSWGCAEGGYDHQQAKDCIDQLWMARQGVLPQVLEESPAAQRTQKSKKIGEIMVEKGFLTEDDLGDLIEAQQNARQATLGDILVERGLIATEDLNWALAEQQKTPERQLGEILVSGGKIDRERLDEAVKDQGQQREAKLGEIMVKSNIAAPDVAQALREQKQINSAASRSQSVTHTVKVETMKLDGLIDLVGELVIAQSLITSNESIINLKEQKITKDLAQVGRLTSELQRNAMSLRMVQIRQTFQKMERLVRDLAHKFDKDVRFEAIGSDTEIDRNMVESIYDPLVHLVRNALDHGLETPQQRLTKGKPAQGLVRLKAYHQGGNVVIELFDDGRGLDTKKVLNKAISQGLISEGENLSEAAIHALVFQPGFSTAEAVSEVSGRGVGMDVVKKSVEMLRGKVDFTSIPDQGSTMTIRLPLTLAIIDGMIVRVGRHRYILPTISIMESFRPNPEDYFTVKNQGEMIKVRQSLVPLIRLDRIVGAQGAIHKPEDALVVVVENEGERRCLLVDEVLGKQEVVIKSLGERLKYIRSLAGGTILGDGQVGLILDVAGLFEVSGLSSGPVSFNSDNELSAGDWGMEDHSSWGAGA